MWSPGLRAGIKINEHRLSQSNLEPVTIASGQSGGLISSVCLPSEQQPKQETGSLQDHYRITTVLIWMEESVEDCLHCTCPMVLDFSPVWVWFMKGRQCTAATTLGKDCIIFNSGDIIKTCGQVYLHKIEVGDSCCLVWLSLSQQ